MQGHVSETDDDAEGEESSDGDLMAKLVSFLWDGFEAIRIPFFIELLVVTSISTGGDFCDAILKA